MQILDRETGGHLAMCSIRVASKGVYADWRPILQPRPEGKLWQPWSNVVLIYHLGQRFQHTSNVRGLRS